MTYITLPRGQSGDGAAWANIQYPAQVNPMKQVCFLLLTAILIAGCFDSPTSSTSSVIMPLKVGNQWIGRVTSDSSGTSIVSYDTLTIVQEVVINNETWYKANTGDFYINRANGLLSTPNPNQSGDCACNVIQYPASRGDTILAPEVLVLVPGNPEPVTQKVGREVLATDSTITVPAGSFSCYHYMMKLYSPTNARLVFPNEHFYVPDLGPVLIVSGGRRWELVKAIVN
jgi:hypothetical protein